MIRELKLTSYTKKTITSRQKLAEELTKIRGQGYALDSREIEEDVECIGAPIRDHLGNVTAALSISGPRRKINTPREKQVIGSVVKAAALISSKLGYTEARE